MKLERQDSFGSELSARHQQSRLKAAKQREESEETNLRYLHVGTVGVLLLVYYMVDSLHAADTGTVEGYFTARAHRPQTVVDIDGMYGFVVGAL